MPVFNTISHGRNYCSKERRTAYFIAGLKPGAFTNVDLLKLRNNPVTVIVPFFHSWGDWGSWRSRSQRKYTIGLRLTPSCPGPQTPYSFSFYIPLWIETCLNFSSKKSNRFLWMKVICLKAWISIWEIPVNICYLQELIKAVILAFYCSGRLL